MLRIAALVSLALASLFGCGSTPSTAVVTIASAVPAATSAPAPTARARAVPTATTTTPRKKVECPPGDPICYEY